MCNLLWYRLATSQGCKLLNVKKNSNDFATQLNRFACEHKINWLFILVRTVCIARRFFVSTHEKTEKPNFHSKLIAKNHRKTKRS